MSIIEVLDGRLYQWDTGRRVAIHPLAGQTADEVHFSNNGNDALVVKPALEGGVLVAPIPNILLQEAKNVVAYAVMVSNAGERTTYGRSLFINPRAKPADYVYTETELADYKKLEARVEALEKGGGGGGVTQETDPTVPAWAKTPEKPSYTAAEVGALPDTYTPPVDAALSETSTNPVQNKIVSAKISEVEAIAKGRATGYVFETEADMQSWIAAHADALNVGDNLYIRATDVPDYWWDGTDAKPLETQKVDLTEYAKKSDVPSVDATLTQSGQAADAAAVGEQLSSLSGKIENITGVSLVEPSENDIPKVFIDGEIPTSKTDVLAEMKYISKSMDFHAYIKIKCQGTSSMSYPKKNFSVKLYSDEARATALMQIFRNWNQTSNKFVLKANYIDHSHARNIVSANLWSEIVGSRSDYASLPEEMRTSPRNGAVDGFPIKVYINGTYQGIYTWNIGKDAWMWGMDESNATHVLLCGETNTDGTYAENACNFRALWGGVDGTNWSVEVGTNSTLVKDSLNALISCVMNTTDDEFRAQIGTHLDLQSAIDYYLFQYAICGLDGLAKNMLLATYDLTKWYCGAYDLDSTFGLWWNGSSFVSAQYQCPEQYQEQFSLLWERIETVFYPELKARYAELRSGPLSLPNIYTHFERFMDVIGLDLYAEDLTIYTAIPSGSSNNIKQIRDYIRDRLTYVDEQIAALDAPAEEISCTGITLDQTELTFTEAGSQTLTATVTPENTTDQVVWESNNTDVAIVSNGVVTAKSNGEAVITVTCGDYSASCVVVISGVQDEETDGIDYNLDALADVSWMDNQTYDANTGDLKIVSGEHCTSKFTLQNCAYKLSGQTGSYLALFIWDKNGNFLHTLEWGENDPGVFTAVSDYEYAIKIYSTSAVDTSAFKLIPVNNTETAVNTFGISLGNFSYEYTIPSGGVKLSQAVIDDEFIGAGITSTNDFVTKIKSANIILFLKSGRYVSSKYVDVSSDKLPLVANLNYHNGKMLIQFYGFADGEANSYFAENNFVLTFN